MRTFLAILFAALCATSHGQTMKALAFNTSNGVVVSGTNLSFTSPVSFSTLAFTNITASNITLNGVLSFTNGPTNQLQLTRANLLPAYSGNASKVLALNSTATDVQWVTMTAGTNTNTVNFPILISQGGSGATTASGARNNLSLGAAWLTNTSVATFRSDIGLGAAWLTNANVTNFRTAIGLGATWLTNTNANSFREAVGLGAANNVTLGAISIGGEIDITPSAIIGTAWNQTFNFEERKFEVDGGNLLEWGEENGPLKVGRALSFPSSSNAAATRTNLALGATDIVTFAGLNNNGDITINSTTASNGLLFIRRTNNEPFLGMANLIASNNTTISNETLFRVGVAEATNKAAQFGFRVTRTNNGGEGVAVFSVFGYNALMMIGPSDRSRTNTATNAAIEADIWTISTNRVATLRDTNSGAFTLHQELGFSTGGITTNAPANTAAVALWLRVWIGTNNYRLPLYQ
jgi:hypothetical protein